MPDATGPSNLEYLLGHLRQKSPYGYYYYHGIYDQRYAHHFPLFSISTITAMLRDPRMQFALWLIKGPIQTYTKFFTEEESESPDIHNAIVELNYHFPYAIIHENKDAEQFIIDQFNRFWETGLSKALEALDWGWSASQVMYKQNPEGQLIFDRLFPYYSPQTRCITRNGAVIGFRRDPSNAEYIPIGKGFWHIHQREKHPYYGRSRLQGAHIPWHETWQTGGARDIRRLWYFKNSFDGGNLYYPEGHSVLEDGTMVPNEHTALSMMEAKRTGSYAVFPSNRSLDGKQQWEYEGPTSNPTPQGLLEYTEILRTEELEGIGIPPEVIENSGEGLGGATGRLVPFMAFVASLTPIACDLISDFRQQILDPVLLPLNGISTNYEVKKIVPKSPQAFDLEAQEAQNMARAQVADSSQGPAKD